MNRTISILALMLLMPALPGQSDTRYVWGSNPSPSNPFTNWATAATNIQDAVNASTNGDTVLVTNGTYTLTNEISIAKGITVQSVNGASSTIVSGSYPVRTNRCFSISHSNALLDGFLITNGVRSDAYGGGVYLNAGTVQNCVISSNRAIPYYRGGGVYMNAAGMVRDCTISDNSARYGGGVLCGIGTVSNCAIIRNSSIDAGGGVHVANGLVWNCAINSNRSKYGGGVWVSGNSGIVRNCLISSNLATDTGGGLTFYDGGTAQSCTIVSNTAVNNGGGVWNRAYGANTACVQNTIIYFNTGNNYLHYAPCSYSNCCFTPALSDGSTNLSANNITNDPRLVNLDTGNYRLSSNSPCRNAGTNQSWMLPPDGTDLDGQPRILDLNVDIGAYEYIPKGTIIRVGF